MKQLLDTPASSQLGWVIDVFDGAAATEDEVAARLSVRFQSMFPPARWLALVEAQAPRLRPVAVTRVEVDEQRAKAHLATPDGPVVVVCRTDGDGRIDQLGLSLGTIAGLTPRLPLRFEASAASSAEAGRQQLIVVAGVPGTGKSTLADRLGTELGMPVFAIDWLLGALTPFGGRTFDDLLDLGDELVTTMAYRQLQLGQSAIIDTPGENVDSRIRWETMAAHFGARHHVVICTCSDDTIHADRLTSRVRGIPGWHDAGNWQAVKGRRDNFPMWSGSHVLTIDAVDPATDNLARTLAWLAANATPSS